MPYCANCRTDKKLGYVLGDSCAWSRLSDEQKNYLASKGVSPARFCICRKQADAIHKEDRSLNVSNHQNR